MTFEELEAPTGPLPPEAEEALERYYTIKVEAMQFCGSAYFQVPFLEGFASLALTLPMILWSARGYQHLGQPAAIFRAMSLIDENFGYNPILGHFRQRLGVRILAFRQELDRLIAWYSR
jgi:lysine-N-methylase